MQKFIETIIHAIKSWVKNDAFTADDALEMAMESDMLTPLADVEGTIYTAPDGVIYTL